jgi:hypothetical protein
MKANVEAIGPLNAVKNGTLLTIIQDEIKASEKKVVEKIEANQKDTIGVLTTLFYEGHSDHENRISQLEQDHEFSRSH